jgi:signal transduction histidine kinase
VKTVILLLLAVSCKGIGQTLPNDLQGRERLAYLYERAYSFYTADFERADSLFRWAERLSSERGWATEHAAALRYLGIVAFLSGKYEAALAYYQQSLAEAEALGDPAAQSAVLVEMGNFFKKRDEYDRALDHLRRAEKLARAAGDSVLLSNSLDIQGLVLQDVGDYVSAAELLAEVVSIRRAVRDTIGLSYVYDNLSRLATNEGRFADGLAYLDSSILIRRQLNDRQGEAIAINNQGEILLASGDTVAAIPYLERSLTLSRAVGFTDLQQWTLDLLAGAYAATGEPLRALAAQRGVQQLKDSLYTSETTRRIAEMQERFETERRQRELDRQRALLQRRTAYLVAAALGILLLVGAIAWLIHRQGERRRELAREAALRLRDDRLRISRDLHDHLGAELSIIASDLGRLDRQRGAGGTALAPVAGQVRHAMEQMRETIWAVRLEEADWEDLFTRLRTFAERLDREVPVHFALDPALTDCLLEPQLVLQLYRFGQEAIRNALRHGAPTRVWVTADPKRFEIKDDGKGYDPATVTRGYGLASLRERAEELGGSFYQRASPGAGSTVGIRWNT